MADWKNPPRLFIPGPVKVNDDVLQQLARPTLGHRDKEYGVLHGEVADMLKKLLFTNQYIFLSTSSGSGLWEASIRNCVHPDETVLATCCGAFSDKWGDVVKECGRKVDLLKVEWGKPTLPEEIDAKLSAGKYAAITLIYNETSTGLMNPIYDIAKMMKAKHPNVLVFVDAVSGMIGQPIHFDIAVRKTGWGEGVSIVHIEAPKSVPGRGYYFDFIQWAKAAEKNQTLVTPSIPHIMGLHYQCTKLVKEGIENVWARHKKMADFCRGWAKSKGFELFCDEKYASNTLTTVKNTRGINVGDVIKAVKAKHNTIFSAGYGDLKDKTFRIAHMGDITLAEVQELCGWISEEIG